MVETRLDSLVVQVRADVSDFRDQLDDIETGFGNLDHIAQDLTRAMTGVFEDFARTGRISFDSLRDVALSAINDIANSLLQSGIDSIFGAGDGFDFRTGGILPGLFDGIFGRAGGGTVASGRPYVVGERGPELFVPETPGRIMTNANASAAGGGVNRTTNITINMNNNGGSVDNSRRSAGQVAVAVRRAVERAERNL